MGLISFLLCMFSGLVAGLATGFCGLSAAVIISPVLIAFVGVPSYDAVGIALASDVFASAASSYTYYRNKNINIKNGIVMMVFAVASTLLGSRLAFFFHTSNERVMEFIPVAVTTFIGLRFLLFSDIDSGRGLIHYSKGIKLIASAVGGSLIGLICGTVGAGGGMALLIVLTAFLGYDLKTAVGTSVFIMTFLAATGALSHFIFSLDFTLAEYYQEMTVTILFTLAGAVFASQVANRVSQKKMKLITGAMLLFIGIFTFAGVLLGWNIG